MTIRVEPSQVSGIEPAVFQHALPGLPGRKIGVEHTLPPDVDLPHTVRTVSFYPDLVVRQRPANAQPAFSPGRPD